MRQNKRDPQTWLHAKFNAYLELMTTLRAVTAISGETHFDCDIDYDYLFPIVGHSKGNQIKSFNSGLGEDESGTTVKLR